MIRIVLYQNTNQKIAEACGKWFPRVVSDETIGLEELAAHMASHNTPYSKGAILGMLTDAAACTKELLLLGKNVKFADIAIHFEIPEDKMKVLMQGHIPEAQEDHWFMYCDRSHIRYYRSWTGECAFEAHFHKDKYKYIIDHLFANHALNEFGVNGDIPAKVLFLYLVYSDIDGVNHRCWLEYLNAWEEQYKINVDAAEEAEKKAKEDEEAKKKAEQEAELKQQELEGDLMAMNNMGVCYAQGIGVVEDHVMAFQWYMKAAELGDTYACYNVAECYYQGDGVEQDFERALHWYLIAAEKGDVQSQVNAANAFYLGQGTKEDHVKAHQWWLKAAQRGHLQSQKNVGANYWNGDGVEKDDSWAAFWYEMAGQQGDAQAQFSTGWFYMTGTGVKQDKRKGLKWIHRATAQGFEHAKQWCRDNGYSIY